MYLLIASKCVYIHVYMHTDACTHVYMYTYTLTHTYMCAGGEKRSS